MRISNNYFEEWLPPPGLAGSPVARLLIHLCHEAPTEGHGAPTTAPWQENQQGMPGLLWLWHPAPPTEHATILFQVAISEFRIRTDGAKNLTKFCLDSVKENQNWKNKYLLTGRVQYSLVDSRYGDGIGMSMVWAWEAAGHL